MRSSKGFTLIELMITIAIVAILAAIAIPSYSDYIKRSRITEAVSTLSGMRVKMEQFFQDNRSYVNACTVPPAVSIAPRPDPTANFTFTCPTLSPTAYKVRAIGFNSMTGFTYEIDQNNVRSTPAVPTGWTPSLTCWVLNKDGSC